MWARAHAPRPGHRYRLRPRELSLAVVLLLILGAWQWVLLHRPTPPAKLKISFMFLTKGDHQHPQLWQRFLASHEGHYTIVSHVKNPEELTHDLLKGTVVPEHIPTAWGTISLVRATLVLLRHAFRDPLVCFS